MARIFRRLYDFPKPTIAAVNGAAIAGGAGLATMCDFTLAAPEAKFGYTEVRVGFMPALVSMFLERQVGEKVARDLFLTGRIVDAAEARTIGLVTRVVPAEQLLPAAHELAATLIGNSPGSVLATIEYLQEASKVRPSRAAETVVFRAPPPPELQRERLRERRQYAIRSFALRTISGFSTTQAVTSSPHWGSGTPKTAASRTAG